MKKVVFGVLILFLSAVIALAGCSNSNSIDTSTNTEDAVNSTEQPSNNSSSDEKVTITWWSMDTSTFVDANKKMIEAYKKSNPNVTIDYQYFPYDAFIQKLKASYASKNPPDVAQMFGTWVTDYAKNGLLLELNDDSIKNDMYEAPLGGYTYEGKLYGIPHEFNIENNGMLAHKAMFDDQGVSYPPKTWDEMMDAAEKLTVRDGDKINVRGYDFTGNDPLNFSFLAMILQQGGNYWAEEGHVNFNTPEAETAMSTLADMVTKQKITDMSLFGSQESPYMTFFKGNSAMTLSGPWVIAEGQTTFGVNDFDYIPVPPFAGDKPVFAAESGWGEVVSKVTKHPKEALEFINFTAQPEQAKVWNLTTFTVPANKNVTVDPDFISQVPLMQTSIDSLEYGQWIGPVGDRDFWFKVVGDNFQAVTVGNITVQDALKKITDDINQMIDRHK